MKPEFQASENPNVGAGRKVEIEMRNMNDETNSTSSREWLRGEKQKATFRDKWSPFPWRTFFVVLTLPLALTPIVALAAAAEGASQSYIRGRDCYPNGSWKGAPGATWRIMDSSYFFTPNLSFGAFTFTKVKVIDIAWDLIIGRGGQILLAWVNYRVFNEWLVYHMEMHMTSYKMYAAVAFQTTTMSTLGVLGKEFLAFGDKTWKRMFRWLGILSMLLSTLYVLSFPTLMGALTGYIPTTKPYLENYAGNLIEWNQIQRVLHTVHDADRLNYTRPLVVTQEDESLRVSTEKYMSQFNWADVTLSDTSGTGENVTTFYANQSSRWEFEGKVVELLTPSLNISTYMIGQAFTMIPATQDWETYLYLYALDGRQSERLYNTRYLLEHSSCKPSETYQWGFSYIFLFMVSIFNFIWACISVGMWVDTRRGSRMYNNGRRPGLLRSILDYSAAIREELGTASEYLQEEDLRKGIRDGGGALVVPRSELRVARTSTGDEKVRKRSWKRTLTKGSTF